MDITVNLPKSLMAQIVAQMMTGRQAAPRDAVGLEECVQVLMHQLGGMLLEALLASMAKRYPPKTVPCKCGSHARYQSRRGGVLETIYGRLHYRRAYYVCPACHHGQSPLDRELGLRPGQVSVKLASLLGMLGSQTAYGEATRLTRELLLLDVSENTIRKQTQRYGRMQSQREAQWQESSEDPEQLFARRRSVTVSPERLYGSLDGVIVPVDKQWRELKIVCWYEAEPGTGPCPGPEPPVCRAKNISYYADLSDAASLRPLVWSTGVQRNVDLAKEVVFIADGAAWIWKLVQYHFPHAVQIVDWYHAVAYLTPIAQAMEDHDAEGASAWLESTRELLWEGRVFEVIAACQSVAHHRGVQEPAHRATTYYQHNAERMDYAHWRAEGYLIGSGVVESACKQIGTQRLKRAGARWSADGAQYVAKARAAWLSHTWDNLQAYDLQLAQAA